MVTKNSPRVVKPTKLYGYPCFKYGDWRVIRKIPTYWGEKLSMVTYKNEFAYLTYDGFDYVGTLLIKRNPDSKDYDYDVGLSIRRVFTPKQIIKIIQTPISPKDRYWVLSFGTDDSTGIFPKQVNEFLIREI